MKRARSSSAGRRWLVGGTLGAFFLFMVCGFLLGLFDAQGGSNGDCDDVTQALARSGSGYLAHAHTTACSGFGGSVVTYVHVHRAGEAQSRSNLVFRYSPAGANPEARLRWIGAERLEIGTGPVARIDEKITRVGRIEIIYDIDPADHSRAHH